MKFWRSHGAALRQVKNKKRHSLNNNNNNSIIDRSMRRMTVTSVAAAATARVNGFFVANTANIVTASGGPLLRRIRCSRRACLCPPCARSFSSVARTRMKPQSLHQLWHVTDGITFTRVRDGPVVYPTLAPLARSFHSTSTARAASPSPSPREREEDSSEPPESEPEPSTGPGQAASENGSAVSSSLSISASVLVKRSSETKVEEVCGLVEKSSPDGDHGSFPTKQEAVESKAQAKNDAAVPPFTPLPFKIPPEAFREARAAPPGSPDSFWSHLLYRGPGEGTDAKVRVHYCRSRATTERVIQQHFAHERVVGFDLEWVPNATRAMGARRNVCLVQLASASRVALFHVALYPRTDGLVAPALKRLMEDPAVLKTGVNISSDCSRLRTFLGIHARGVFELSHLYKLVKYSASGETRFVNRKVVRLAAQVEEYLGLPMFKGPDVRSSDWSQPLRMEQIIYSAGDAYAAVQLFAVLDHQRQNLVPTPPLPYPAELKRPIRLADGVTTIPAADEAPEEDDGDSKNGGKVTSALSARYLASLGESIKIEENDSEPILLPPKLQRQQHQRAIATATASPAPKDARIVEAEAWLAQYRASHPQMRAAAAALRAYRIWHAHDDMAPAALARLLRDPPLQVATVVSYILEAVRLEKLPFEKARLREVLTTLPGELLLRRYKTLARACGLGTGMGTETGTGTGTETGSESGSGSRSGGQ